MNRSRIRNRLKGFTLIETMLYLALYALLIGGAFSAAYAFSESSDRSGTAALLSEEATFLMGKIGWTLAAAVSMQQSAATSSELDAARSDGSTVRIRESGPDIRMQIGEGVEQSLNASHISVANLAFVKIAEPDGISASFTLAATTSEGRRVSRDFSTFVPSSE